MNNKSSDEQLMLIYKNNSPSEAILAFNELYGRFSQRVYNYLNSRTKNPALSDDLLQRVFLKIHESKHLFDPKYKFEQWIFVIARSITLDNFRSQKRYDMRLKNVEILEDTDIQEENFILESLEVDTKEMELLEMKYVDELSYAEISEILGKSETSLRKSVSRLIGRLRKG